MDKPIPILLVVDVKLGILPVVDNSAILSAAVIFGNNFTPLFPEKIFEIRYDMKILRFFYNLALLIFSTAFSSKSLDIVSNRRTDSFSQILSLSFHCHRDAASNLV